jgi:hypothetical protein
MLRFGDGVVDQRAVRMIALPMVPSLGLHPYVGVAGEHLARDVPRNARDHAVARAQLRQFSYEGAPGYRAKVAFSRTFVHTVVNVSTGRVGFVSWPRPVASGSLFLRSVDPLQSAVETRTVARACTNGKTHPVPVAVQPRQRSALVLVARSPSERVAESTVYSRCRSVQPRCRASKSRRIKCHMVALHVRMIVHSFKNEARY